MNLVANVTSLSFVFPQSEKNKIIIRNVSLQTYSSQILAIVGPSGCGKTTLIKLIISLLPVDHGKITLFGYDCTNNPENRKIVGTHLESLGIAILHVPQLLLLDEPTVGVDPILRHRIWKLLEKMKNNGASILITTHYIEECGHADTMSFMRNGEILETESPQAISARDGFISFEKVFLDLCSMKVDTTKKLFRLSEELPSSFHHCSSIQPKSYDSGYQFDIRIFFILMYRYFHLFIFTPASFFCILGVPTFNVYMTYLSISQDVTHVSIGLCIQNQSLYNDTTLLKKLNIKPVCLECIHPDNFPEYINDKVFHVIKYDDISKAINDVSRYKIYAAVHIREGFADALFQKLILDWSELNVKLIRDSQIAVYCDASNSHIFRAVEGYLSDAYAKYWEACKGNLGLKQLSAYPMRFENSVIDGKNIEEHSSRSWFLLGGLIVAVTSSTIITAGSAITREVKDQSIQRYMSTGLSCMQIFLVQLFSNTILLGLAGILSLVTSLLLLDVECQGSPFIAALLIVGMILNSALIGQLIGLSQLSEVLVLILGIGITYVTGGMEGAYISTESFPYFIKNLSIMLPNTYPIKAMRDTVLIGISPTNPIVITGFFTLSIYFILLFLASFKLTSNRVGRIKGKRGPI